MADLSLGGLSDQQKQTLILERGIPWLSLLYLPGHVMLYLGAPQGQPLVLQALWGLKTRGPSGEGRRLVGRVVITGLNPGAELPDLARPEGLLLPGSPPWCCWLRRKACALKPTKSIY